MKIFKFIKKHKRLVIVFTLMCSFIFLSWPLSGCDDLKNSGNIGTGSISAVETQIIESSNGSQNQDNASGSEAGDNSISSETGDDTINKNMLTAGTDPTFPPFAFTQEGQISGFDVDIITEVVKRLDKELQITASTWDLEFKELLEGNLDMVISAVSYSSEKESLVDFSIPYFNMKFMLISLVGSEIQLKENLVNGNVGMLESSKDYLEKEYLADFNIVYFKDVIEMLDSLKNKETDAVLLNLPIAINLIRENKDMYIVLEETASLKDFVIVFKNNSSLKPAVDKALEEMQADGTYDEIYAKWFEQD